MRVKECFCEMNYLWEIMLAAKEQGIDENEINFKAARKYSPYMELSEEFLNKAKLEEPYPPGLRGGSFPAARAFPAPRSSACRR